MPEQSEGNNHTSKINVFPVLHTIFFLLWGQKMDLFAPHGAIKSTLWPASRKKYNKIALIEMSTLHVQKSLRETNEFLKSLFNIKSLYVEEESN